MNNIPHSIVRWILCIFACIFTGSMSLKAQDLPVKLHTAIDKTLDDQFSDIEKALIQVAKLDQKEVLLITVPLENYIEDVLFTINRPAVIYPQTIYRFIREQFVAGKTRTEIERLLVDIQKRNGFVKLYAVENPS